MKVICKIIMPAVVLFFGSCVAQSRVTVAVKPPVPVVPVVVSPPPPPFPGAVWIAGGTIWQGGRYVYIAPHYAHPREARKFRKAAKHARYNTYARERKLYNKSHRRY